VNVVIHFIGAPHSEAVFEICLQEAAVKINTSIVKSMDSFRKYYHVPNNHQQATKGNM